MEINKFFAKPQKVTILGEDVEVVPVTTEQIPNIAKAQYGETVQERNDASMELAYGVFKQIFPKSTKEDFKKVSGEAFGEIMTAFYKVNGLDEDKIAEKLKNEANKSE